jgi:hypothetical protein
MSRYALRIGETAGTARSLRITTGGETVSAVPRNVSRKVAPLMSRSQTYYWTRKWQAGEQETLRELAAGNGIEFSSARDTIRWLLSEDE